jgi:hypothetical protein
VKVPDRKVLKLGVQQQDLNRFVQVHQQVGTKTLAETLTHLLDHYETSNRSSSSD